MPIDDFGIFEHVADGVVMDVGEVTFAFFGRIDAPGAALFDFDRAALEALLAVDGGSVDVLVTHDGAYGMSEGWNGRVQGSLALTQLIEHLRPRLPVSGHYHHVTGPRSYGATTSYALAQLVAPKTKPYRTDSVKPDQQVSPGSLALLDTDTWAFRYVTDRWLEDIRGDDIDLAAALDRYAM